METSNPETKFQRRRPGIMIAAVKGGAGKTIATLGLIRALTLENRTVVPFKKGPDYIDARWMAMAARHHCYNLDPYLMDREVIEASFMKREPEGSISIVEGNRGLHDGVDIHGSCSTAELAKWLHLPVLLVVDCTKVTRTTAAVVAGCAGFDPDVRIAGVILNHIARPRHEDIITRSIEYYTDIPVIGAIYRMKQDPLPMRHLGLTPADEHSRVTELLDNLANQVKGSVDLERTMEIAAEGIKSPAASSISVSNENLADTIQKAGSQPEKPCVGIIRDSAFQFYYPENLEAIEQAGARLIFLDSTSDSFVPDEVDAIYIGGGFPETQAERLANNESFRTSLRRLAEAGLPVYAECGGLMYLGKHIIWQGRTWPMTGIIDWNFRVQSRPAGHGYTILEVTEDNAFFSAGTTLKGHEFHYSVPERPDAAAEGQQKEKFTCMVKRGHGFQDRLEGIAVRNVFGTYTHIHALGNERWGENMVNAARAFRSVQNNE